MWSCRQVIVMFCKLDGIKFWFLFLGMRQCFWIATKSTNWGVKTFTHNLGQCRVEQMVFGSRVRPQMFQRVMDVLLLKVEGHFALMFLDNIVILLCLLRDRIKSVRHLLSPSRGVRTTLKLKKWNYCKDGLENFSWLFQLHHLKTATHNK